MTVPGATEDWAGGAGWAGDEGAGAEAADGLGVVAVLFAAALVGGLRNGASLKPA